MYFAEELCRVEFGITYSDSIGSFAFATGGGKDGHGCRPSKWYTCREDFHGENHKRTRRILFTCGEHNAHNVADFINRIERILKIPRDQRTFFAATGRSKIVWMQVSAWWYRYSIRRSLFTILLRAGKHYTGENFDEIVSEATYLNNTQNAFTRFLQGFTKCTKRTVGWYKTFYTRTYHEPSRKSTTKEVQELLVKP